MIPVKREGQIAQSNARKTSGFGQQSSCCDADHGAAWTEALSVFLRAKASFRLCILINKNCKGADGLLSLVCRFALIFVIVDCSSASPHCTY